MSLLVRIGLLWLARAVKMMVMISVGIDSRVAAGSTLSVDIMSERVGLVLMLKKSGFVDIEEV